MDIDISCFSCKYYDEVCCMKNCKCMAILDEWETARKCKDYIIGHYNETELERLDYE